MGLLIPVQLIGSSKSIIGVNMLRIADEKPFILETCLKEMIVLYKAGKISPLPGYSFKSNEIADAHQFLESGKSTGKITVEWEKKLNGCTATRKCSINFLNKPCNTLPGPTSITSFAPSFII